MSVAKAKAAGSPTKTGSQLVGASAIYDLGLELIERARGLGPRSLAVSIEFRNGLLLAIAAALPQRARALSLLFFGSSLCLQEFPVVRISLPGHALKLPEHRKRGEGFERVFENADLWCALDDYQRLFRPLFDDGDALFPSARDFGVALDSRRLGKLVGDLTEQHLGVRVSIHRVRDNVATEASEELRSGGYPAPALLGHSNPATTMANYDHARGVGAARDHLCFLETQRSFKAALRL